MLSARVDVVDAKALYHLLRAQGTRIMFLYYGISFVFSVLALAAWMIGAITHVPVQQRDGSGPDGVVILLYLSLWPVGLLLAHSALLALIVRERSPASLMQGRWGLRLHGILGGGFLLYALHLFRPG